MGLPLGGMIDNIPPPDLSGLDPDQIPIRSMIRVTAQKGPLYPMFS
jgi:hypothetical protein